MHSHDKGADESAADHRDTSSLPGVPFAHPTEEVFAQILDYYAVQWEYEPRTFPLDWDKEGEITQAFTPDFYLTQEDLYVELTTLRPSLTTPKNRKLRRMQQLYPDVNVKLLKRRDLRDMMIRYGLDREAQTIAGTAAQKRSA